MFKQDSIGKYSGQSQVANDSHQYSSNVNSSNVWDVPKGRRCLHFPSRNEFILSLANRFHLLCDLIVSFGILCARRIVWCVNWSTGNNLEALNF
ncbi:hypothetical protein AVEN_166170-1 [Araneus ventricosus]|uniref:Uncharacterized protein n=1 Tax=Araneus ventricosus TaxID=182803 RepID=A0A4Y2NF43_ARAVE|nr:hypothetical protein AVEN_166170-1 [Araneus ventricosus]